MLEFLNVLMQCLESLCGPWIATGDFSIIGVCFRNVSFIAGYGKRLVCQKSLIHSPANDTATSERQQGVDLVSVHFFFHAAWLPRRVVLLSWQEKMFACIPHSLDWNGPGLLKYFLTSQRLVAHLISLIPSSCWIIPLSSILLYFKISFSNA